MIKKINIIKKTISKAAGKVSGRISRRKPVLRSKSSSQKQTSPQTTKINTNKVLMFGWELPPYNSGGLGVACYELAQSLTSKKTKVTFVLPKRQDIKLSFMKLAFADSLPEHHSSSTSRKINQNIKFRTIDSPLSPYLDEKSYLDMKRNTNFSSASSCSSFCSQYGDDLIDEVYRYGEAAGKVALEEDFKVIHAHDWLSYPAGITAKKVSKKPLITHVHALEYDRSHEAGVNQSICAIERAGLEASDKIIAVSAYTKQRIMQYYHIPADKIEVVHNGINLNQKPKKHLTLKSIKSGGKKMVLFVGRITYQKGVDYLIEAAYKALKHNPKMIFMIVGSGDMTYQIIEQAAYFGISDKVFFPGFLRGDDLEKIYQSADLYVMPSVSEPFGLVALEALSNNVPVIVSKQSGAAEVLNHSLKVDFWDTDDLANKMVAVINNTALRHSLSKYGHKEVLACTWDLAADKCIKVYNQLATS